MGQPHTPDTVSETADPQHPADMSMNVVEQRITSNAVSFSSIPNLSRHLIWKKITRNSGYLIPSKGSYMV